MQDPTVPFFSNSLHFFLSASMEAALLTLLNRCLKMKRGTDVEEPTKQSGHELTPEKLH
jgi:hypothetical protein